MTATPSTAEIVVRAAIEDALHTYCRGIDRLDGPTIAAAFHADAILEGYGNAGPTVIGAFVTRVLESLRTKYVATQHRLSNIAVVLDGETALVESYVLAYHVTEHAAGRTLTTFNGRYVDRFEARDGDWRIAHRDLRIDWSDISSMGAAMVGAYVPSGRDGTADPFLG